MASIHDVTAYILERQGPMTAFKLQKLVYYSQAWHLVWEDQPLFSEPIEAWGNGPVSPALYEKHQGAFDVEAPWRYGLARRLTASERESIGIVLEFYGDRSSQWLSDLTHAERPWKEARMGLRDGEQGHREITHDALVAYYGSL